MSLSTTSTAVYILSKYSRAYQSVPTTGTQDADAEWQHFTNPVIRLVLDIKKTGNGELESYRVRIIWSINSGGGGNSMNADQQEVCFEDLDLLAFSSDPLQAQNTSMAVHGLPLRAVYREGVVGIRYLHPRVVPAGGTPTYRRLQMSFLNTADATAFIDAIRVVCPCKANPPPQGSLARANTMAIHPQQASSAKANNAAMLPPHLPASATSALRPAITMQAPPSRPSDLLTNVSRTSAMARNIPPKQPPTLKTSASMLPPPEPRSALRQSATMAASVSTGYMRSPAASQLPQPKANTEIVCGAPAIPVSVAVSLGSSSLSPAPVSSASNAPSSVATRAPVSLTSGTSVPLAASSTTLNGGLPSSSPPTPSPGSGRKHLFVSEADIVLQTSTPPAVQPTANVPQDVPMDVDVEEVPQPMKRSAGDTRLSEANKSDPPFMESLLKLPSLYELSRSDLEALVAEVIREEEFVKLLRDLDSMWRVKALLG